MESPLTERQVSLSDVPEPAAVPTPDEEAAVHNAELVESIFRLVMDQEVSAGAGAELTGMIETLRSELTLTAEDRLLLRMVFEDGMKSYRGWTVARPVDPRGARPAAAAVGPNQNGHRAIWIGG